MKFWFIALAIVVVTISVNRGRPSVCELPREVGLCRALLERYYYNYTARSCKFFYYGGCGGNLNNFMSLKECKDTCG